MIIYSKYLHHDLRLSDYHTIKFLLVYLSQNWLGNFNEDIRFFFFAKFACSTLLRGRGCKPAGNRMSNSFFLRSAIKCTICCSVKWTILSFSMPAFYSKCDYLFSGFGTKLSDKVNHFIFLPFYHFCSCNINFLFLLIYRKSLVKVY